MTLQHNLEALMISDKDTQAVYEIFRDGKPKYQMIWTNFTKRFYISGEEVTEDVWLTSVGKDKV